MQHSDENRIEHQQKPDIMMDMEMAHGISWLDQPVVLCTCTWNISRGSSLITNRMFTASLSVLQYRRNVLASSGPTHPRIRKDFAFSRSGHKLSEICVFQAP